MPSFDTAFQALVNWQTLLFCLGIYVVTYVVRLVVETLWKGAKDSTLWTELGLHIGPIGTGALLAMFAMAKFPWPMPIGDSMLGKAFYGSICGMASGWVYSRFRAWLNVAADNENPLAMKMLGRKPAAGLAPGDRPTPTIPPPSPPAPPPAA